MAGGGSDPWHELTISASYFHHLAGKPPGGPENWCGGHDDPNAECDQAVDDDLDVEIDRELTHPEECKDDRKPCGECEGCKIAGPENCDHTAPWRCQTGFHLDEFGDFYDELTPGKHRVRAYGSGPDYWGEYEEGLEIERESQPVSKYVLFSVPDDAELRKTPYAQLLDLDGSRFRVPAHADFVHGVVAEEDHENLKGELERTRADLLATANKLDQVKIAAAATSEELGRQLGHAERELLRVRGAAAATDEAATKAEKAWMAARLEADQHKDRADREKARADDWEKSFERMSDAYAKQVETTSEHQRRAVLLEKEINELHGNLSEENRCRAKAEQAAARYADAMATAIGIIDGDRTELQ